MEPLLDCAATRWQPAIGDPTWQGWATVVLCAVVALLALRKAGQGDFPAVSRGRERVFWTAAALAMAVLAVNKQLDLQSALTALGRCAAKAQGWYQQRRIVQVEFLMVLAVMGLSSLGLMLRLLRGTLRRTALPIVGLVFVLCFVLMCAVDFHYGPPAGGFPDGGAGEHGAGMDRPGSDCGRDHAARPAAMTETK